MMRTHLSTLYRIDEGLQQIAIDMTAGKTPAANLQERIRTLVGRFTEWAHCHPRDVYDHPSSSPLANRVARRLESASEWAEKADKDFKVAEILFDLAIEKELSSLLEDIKNKNTNYKDTGNRLNTCLGKFRLNHGAKEGEDYYCGHLAPNSIAYEVAKCLHHLSNWFSTRTPRYFHKRRNSF